jgi:hypothetical protein
MAINFYTSNPSNLLAQFDKRIAQTEPKGKVMTWIKTPDGKHYTHTSADWKGKAFFRPVIHAGKLTFNIIRPEGKNIASVVYGYYHGHIIETFLNHFDSDFSTGEATALPAAGDDVAAR